MVGCPFLTLTLPCPLFIPRLVRDAVNAGNHSQIDLVVKMLDDYTTSANPHIKKGGLIGLAAVAAGLGTQVERGGCGTRSVLEELRRG